MEASYKVAFGSGTGALRTRRQAMTDLYREIRERTGWGTQLAVQVHRLDRPSILTKGPSARPSSSEADALAEAAFQLMDAVDREGEVSIDVAPVHGTCKLSLGSTDSEGGADRCLISEPKPEGRGGR
jgi:hypothetical protein